MKKTLKTNHYSIEEFEDLSLDRFENIFYEDPDIKPNKNTDEEEFHHGLPYEKWRK